MNDSLITWQVTRTSWTSYVWLHYDRNHVLLSKHLCSWDWTPDDTPESRRGCVRFKTSRRAQTTRPPRLTITMNRMCEEDSNGDKKACKNPRNSPEKPNTTRWRGDIVWTLSDSWWNRQQALGEQKNRLSRVAAAQSRLRMRIYFILYIKWSCKSGETIEDIPAKLATNRQKLKQSGLTK